MRQPPSPIPPIPWKVKLALRLTDWFIAKLKARLVKDEHRLHQARAYRRQLRRLCGLPLWTDGQDEIKAVDMGYTRYPPDNSRANKQSSTR